MRNTRKRWIVGVLCLVMLLCSVTAHSATSTGSGFWLEDAGVKLFTLAKNVVVPLLLIGIVLFMGANVAFGWVQVGSTLGRGLLGCAIVLGGIETLLLFLGGTAATALVL